MGFNKRIIDWNFIDTNLKQGKTFKEIFDAGAIVFMDRRSSKAYELFLKKFSDSEIIEEVEKIN